MIYKFAKFLSNVISFEPSSGYYLVNDKIKSTDNNSIDIRLERCRRIEKFGKELIIIDNLNRPYILNNNKLNYELTNLFRTGALKFPYIEFYKRETPRIYGIYNYESRKILFETKDWIGRNIIGEYIVGEYQGEISCRNISSDFIQWQFSLSYFGKFKSNWEEERDYEIEQFIGVFNNILWIKISFFSGGLIGLDVETGELRHQLKFSDDFIGSTSIKTIKDDEVPFFRCNYSLLDEGKIIGLANDIYYEIDLTTDKYKVTAYGLDDEFQKFGIDKEDISHNNVLQETLLYFFNHNQHTFGVFNIETKKIIYLSEKINVPDTQEAWGKLKDLKVSDDKVYILDSTHTLHIFEQESRENYYL
jgi:hypothetical protein